MKQKEKTQYLTIPIEIADDSRLYDGAKVLYGRICALCRKTGFCWAGNEYFASLHYNNKKTISRWLRNLEENGYIKTDVMFTDDTGKKGERCISILELGEEQKCPTFGQKCLDIGQNCPKTETKMSENGTKMSQNTDKNVPPYTLYNRVNNRVMNKRERITEKNAFGFYKNVFLSLSEHRELKEKFPIICDQIIEELSGYMQSKNKTYDDHAATVRLWCERKSNELNNKKTVSNQKGRLTTEPSYDIEQIEKDSYADTLNFGK